MVAGTQAPAAQCPGETLCFCFAIRESEFCFRPKVRGIRGVLRLSSERWRSRISLCFLAQLW